MEPTRRQFLRGLGILIGATAVKPVAEVLIPEVTIPEPHRKIWAVGAQLENGLVALKPRRVVFPRFEIVHEMSLIDVTHERILSEHFERDMEKLVKELAQKMRNDVDQETLLIMDSLSLPPRSPV